MMALSYLEIDFYYIEDVYGLNDTATTCLNSVHVALNHCLNVYNKAGCTVSFLNKNSFLLQ